MAVRHPDPHVHLFYTRFTPVLRRFRTVSTAHGAMAGPGRRTTSADELAKFDVVLTTYSVVQSEHSARFRSRPPCCKPGVNQV